MADRQPTRNWAPAIAPPTQSFMLPPLGPMSMSTVGLPPLAPLMVPNPSPAINNTLPALTSVPTLPAVGSPFTVGLGLPSALPPLAPLNSMTTLPPLIVPNSLVTSPGPIPLSSSILPPLAALTPLASLRPIAAAYTDLISSDNADETLALTPVLPSIPNMRIAPGRANEYNNTGFLAVDVVSVKPVAGEPVYENDQGRATNSKGQPLALELYSFQEPHFARISMILEKGIEGRGPSPYYFDISTTGLGKTVTTIAGSIRRNVPLFVFGPESTLEAVWKTETRLWGARVEGLFNYSSAGHVSGDMTSWVSRNNDQGVRAGKTNVSTAGAMKNRQVYRVTQAWVDLVMAGVQLVIDEVHHMKNDDTNQLRAIAPMTVALLRLVKAGKAPRSSIAFLSASPFEQPEKAVTFFRILGFLGLDDQLIGYDRKAKTYFIIGLASIVKNCMLIDRAATLEIVNRYTRFIYHADGTMTLVGPGVKPENDSIALSSDLFKGVIKPGAFSSMERPPAHVDDRFINGFYKLSREEDRQRLAELVSEAARRLEGDGNDNEESLTKSGVFTLINEIEKIKVGIFAKIIHESILDGDARGVTTKAIGALWTKAAIEKLEAILISLGYKPLVLTGDVAGAAARKRMIDRFQRKPEVDRLQGTEPERILLCTIQTGGEGISLHDKFGDSPRTMVISPGYKFIQVFQAAGRIYRAPFASRVTVIIPYAQLSTDSPYGNAEQGVFKSIMEKGTYMSELLETENQRSAMLPSQFTEYREK